MYWEKGSWLARGRPGIHEARRHDVITLVLDLSKMYCVAKTTHKTCASGPLFALVVLLSTRFFVKYADITTCQRHVGNIPS